MYGMTINGLHSFKDLGLVPTLKPHVNLPSPRFSYLEVPGRLGSFDLTESLAGEVLYEMREGSFEFIVADKGVWQKAYERLKRDVHGLKTTLVLDSESSFYYQGRVWVSDFKSDKNYETITLNYRLNPYKHSVLDIKTGGVYTLKNVQVKDGKEISLTRDFDMTLIPEFTNKTLNTISVDFKGKTYSLKQGVSRFPELRTRENNMTLTFQGTGTLDISYLRGWL